MSRQGRYVVAIAVAVWLAFTVAVLVQERPIREPRTWQVLELAAPGNSYHFYPDVRVDIVDTQGVCLYIVRAAWTTSQANAPSATVAAVPKTQLPAGAGCQ